MSLRVKRNSDLFTRFQFKSTALIGLLLLSSFSSNILKATVIAELNTSSISSDASNSIEPSSSTNQSSTNQSSANQSLANNSNIIPQKIQQSNSSLPNKTAQSKIARQLELKLQRGYYKEANQALDKKQLSRYQQLVPRLRSYPLYPYLEYRELGDRLNSLPIRDVEAFFAHNSNTYVGERMRHRWLRTLAQKERWADYLRFYDAQLTDPELACLNLRAKLETGNKAALKSVDVLWNIDKPQSKACDPVFAQWIAAGFLTPAILWDRHLKAVKANEISLAHSLALAMPPREQALALQYENMAQNPRLVLQPEEFNTQLQEVRTAVALGLEKYAQIDPQAALNLWNIYSARGHFSFEESTSIKYAIARQLVRQDQGKLAETLVANTPNLSNPDLLEALIREALRQQDWEKSYRWILRLPPDIQKTERWSYWLAKVMEKLRIKEIDGKRPRDIYARIASTRGFYGFLSADKLGVEYSFVDKPLKLSKEFLEEIEQNPGIERAHEFFILDDLVAAAQEWVYTTHHFPTMEEMVAAGRIADQWGWNRQAIQTMTDAQYLDELQVRFPIVFHEHVNAAARKTSGLDASFIFAITRQESAFMKDAKSPVGAMGLMQLMPSTAKNTAKKKGMTYKLNDLFNADKNILLGSHYLDDLMKAFGGNRILASAAYNAGPNRVKQWMNTEGDKVPFDIWIETIPYKETRGYVQNVLSFAVIYAYRTGNKRPMITPQEAAQNL